VQNLPSRDFICSIPCGHVARVLPTQKRAMWQYPSLHCPGSLPLTFRMSRPLYQYTPPNNCYDERGPIIQSSFREPSFRHLPYHISCPARATAESHDDSETPGCKREVPSSNSPPFRSPPVEVHPRFHPRLPSHSFPAWQLPKHPMTPPHFLLRQEHTSQVANL